MVMPSIQQLPPLSIFSTHHCCLKDGHHQENIVIVRHRIKKEAIEEMWCVVYGGCVIYAVLTLMFSFSCSMEVAPMMVEATNERVWHHFRAISVGVMPYISAICSKAKQSIQRHHQKKAMYHQAMYKLYLGPGRPFLMHPMYQFGQS